MKLDTGAWLITRVFNGGGSEGEGFNNVIPRPKTAKTWKMSKGAAYNRREMILMGTPVVIADDTGDVCTAYVVGENISNPIMALCELMGNGRTMSFEVKASRGA